MVFCCKMRGTGTTCTSEPCTIRSALVFFPIYGVAYAFIQLNRRYWGTEEIKMVSQMHGTGLTQLARALTCICILSAYGCTYSPLDIFRLYNTHPIYLQFCNVPACSYLTIIESLTNQPINQSSHLIPYTRPRDPSNWQISEVMVV